MKTMHLKKPDRSDIHPEVRCAEALENISSSLFHISQNLERLANPPQVFEAAGTFTKPE